VPFESPDWPLGELLRDIEVGKVQLPDFQREWKWDDDRVISLLAAVSLGYPIGVVMMLETGGDGVRFKPKPLAGVGVVQHLEPHQLLLDGQQRLTSLFQSLKSGQPVDTLDARGHRLRRWYYIDIHLALGNEGDREEAILSVPEDKVIREDFGRTVLADYSTVERECQAGVFPLSRAFEGASILSWVLEYLKHGNERQATWERFSNEVLNRITTYMLPVIKLTKETPKEAVCTVFEKVNTGGIALNVFELLTATFAGEPWYFEKHGDDFRLNEDWRAIQQRFDHHQFKVLASLENTDFLQVVSLLATRERRVAAANRGDELEKWPGISCKRKDILKLRLQDYLRWAPVVSDSMEWAASFMGQQRIFRSPDLPYRTQLVPLAAIRAAVGTKTDVIAHAAKLRRWYWSGVLGEMYGGTTETRFARDLEQVTEWLSGGAEPGTVVDASFHEQRLLTMRTRNSAAYKGLYALLMRDGCMDWIYAKPLDMAAFWSYAVDIHHIFPKAWCEKNRIDEARRESIVNKTALSRETNQRIGGRSPAQYMPIVEKVSGVRSKELNTLLQTHYIAPEYLRTANFDKFFAARTDALLKLISIAMGKQAVRAEEAPAGDRPEDFELQADDPEEEPGETITVATAIPYQPVPPVTDTVQQAATFGATRPVTSAATKSFDRAMRGVYDRARSEAGYNATYLLGMLARHGGLETARRLLHAPAVSEGFTALWERKRLDLTVEALILREDFVDLFTEDEIELARIRLAQFGFPARNRAVTESL
jgi:hypothetical protein